MKNSLLIAMLLGLLLVACAAQPQPNLEGNWVLTSLDGAQMDGNPDITLQFGEDGRAGGSGGCNHYGADYNLSGSRISFGQPMSTLMYCEPEAVMQNEATFLQALVAASELQLSGNTLTLSGGGHTLVFTR